jgi:hypothetical protein
VRFALTFAALVSTGALAVSSPQPEDATLLHRLIDSGTLPDLRWAKFSVQPGLDGDRAPTPQAEGLIRILEGVGAKGLDHEDYDGSRWAGRLARLRPASSHPADEDVARFDLALTISARRYASDLHIGKVNPKVFCFAGI